MYLSQYNRLQTRLAQKESLLEKAYTTYDGLLEQQVSSFEFNSGEADQRATMRKLQDVERSIATLEKEIDHIHRQLRGTSNVRMVMNRRG